MPDPSDDVAALCAAGMQVEGTPGEARRLMASLHLNLGDALTNVGETERAIEATRRAGEHLAAVPAGGYREFLTFGIARLARRLGVNRPLDRPTDIS